MRKPELSDMARALGRLGGRNGTGAAKVRGDSTHYSRISRSRRAIRGPVDPPATFADVERSAEPGLTAEVTPRVPLSLEAIERGAAKIQALIDGAPDTCPSCACQLDAHEPGPRGRAQCPKCERSCDWFLTA